MKYSKEIKYPTRDKPFPAGILYDGIKVVEVIESDTEDTYQPFNYRLENGQTTWIPAMARISNGNIERC